MTSSFPAFIGGWLLSLGMSNFKRRSALSKRSKQSVSEGDGMRTDEVDTPC